MVNISKRVAYVSIGLLLGLTLSTFLNQEHTELLTKNEPPRIYDFPSRPETITITWERDPKKIREKIDEFIEANPTAVDALGVAVTKSKRCKIYAPEPMMNGDVNSLILAHEVSHCFGMRHP